MPIFSMLLYFVTLKPENMMRSFFLYISLIFAFTTSTSTLCYALGGETDPLVLTCRKTTDFGFCVVTLRSDPRSKVPTTDVLSQIALDKLQAQAKATSDYLQGLQKGASGPKGEEVISACINFYGVATSKDVPSAITSLNAKAYVDAISAATAAMKDGEGCQDEITKNPSPDLQMLSYKNKYMHDLSQLGVDLIGLIGK